MSRQTLLAASILVGASVLAFASEDIKSIQALESSNFPTKAEIDQMTEKMRPQVQEIMKVMPTDGNDLSRFVVNQHNIKLPDAPKADAQGFDMEQVIQNYERLKSATTETNPAEPYELLVFVSLSMPEPIIKQYLEQAAEYGAKVVLKGTLDGKLQFQGTQAALIKLKPRSMPRIDINPKAYKQFSITRVPAIVLAKNLPNQPLSDDGCAPPANFLAVTGEVSVPYALNLFKKTKQQDLKSLISMVETSQRAKK